VTHFASLEGAFGRLRFMSNFFFTFFRSISLGCFHFRITCVGQHRTDGQNARLNATNDVSVSELAAGGATINALQNVTPVAVVRFTPSPRDVHMRTRFPAGRESDTEHGKPQLTPTTQAYAILLHTKHISLAKVTQQYIGFGC